MVILQGLLYIPLFGGLEKHHLQSEASKMMSWFNLHLVLCGVQVAYIHGI